MGKFTSLAGRKFGRLKVLDHYVRRPYKSGGQNRTFWLCECSCGTTKEIAAGQLTDGTAESCGCIRDEKSRQRRLVHGGSGTREYRIWKGVRRRCCDPNNPAYKNYGGRGIKICRRWQGKNGLANFLADMGPCPSPAHTLDRHPDNDGGYEPGNCRWATRGEQNRNSRKNHLITHDGQTHPMSVWAELTGIKSGTIGMRLSKGWSVADALTVPVLRKPVR